ncbi:MAG: type II toxin-antitoxin system RelE/ParE family toxin [bacterium]
MVGIKWSKESIDDLKEICRFIALDSPAYSNIFRERIIEIVEYLGLFPEMGRKVPESDDPSVRELIYRNYRIIYQIKNKRLEIITIIYGKRLLNL